MSNTMRTDEVCSSCKWRTTDVNEKLFCSCKTSGDYLEDVKWNHSCQCWEAKDED